MLNSIFTTVALCASTAWAHGAVTGYKIAGKDYPGHQAYSPANSPNVIQRSYPSYDPIMNVASPQMTCNGGRPATQSAPVMPGDSISATWNQWTHSQGPIMVWMFKCAGEFSACTGAGNGWFKIDEAGFHGDGTKVFLDTETPSGWDIAKLVGGGKSWTSTIPKDLAPGNYLIRHELIAMHQAKTPQFYPECAQLVVGGTGTGVPSAEYLTPIPGYAKQTDPNISVDINNHAIPQEYKIPGPPVWGKAAGNATAATAPVAGAGAGGVAAKWGRPFRA